MSDSASAARHTENKIDSSHSGHHIVPAKVYVTVIIILAVLTVLTVEVAFYNMGGLINLIVALGLATIKATVVALYFMHVRHSGRLVQITIFSSLMFLALLIGGVLMDYYTRQGVTLWHAPDERMEIKHDGMVGEQLETAPHAH